VEVEEAVSLGCSSPSSSSPFRGKVSSQRQATVQATYRQVTATKARTGSHSINKYELTGARGVGIEAVPVESGVSPKSGVRSHK